MPGMNGGYSESIAGGTCRSSCPLDAAFRSSPPRRLLPVYPSGGESGLRRQRFGGKLNFLTANHLRGNIFLVPPIQPRPQIRNKDGTVQAQDGNDRIILGGGTWIYLKFEGQIAILAMGALR
ncbi:unnamed protein product [Victoria cruziana]